MTKKTFKVGDRVEITSVNEPRVGQEGVVTDNDTASCYPLTVAFKTDVLGSKEDYFSYTDVKKLPKARKASKGSQRYLGNGKHKYEHVTASTYRLRVPTGWIYETNVGTQGGGTSVFVPLPEVLGYVI